MIKFKYRTVTIRENTVIVPEKRFLRPVGDIQIINKGNENISALGVPVLKNGGVLNLPANQNEKNVTEINITFEEGNAPQSVIKEVIVLAKVFID